MTDTARPKNELNRVALPPEAINAAAREQEPFTRNHPRLFSVW